MGVPPTLLLVDDETRSARLLAKMLREDGYAVEIAFDGAAAIGRLARRPLPDVLITDLRMPHVDGVAVASYDRSLAPTIPVVFITGYPQLVSSAKAKLDPAPIVHTKPIDYGRFSEQVGQISRAAMVDRAKREAAEQSPGAQDYDIDHVFLRKMLGWLTHADDAAALAALLADLSEYLVRHFAREEAEGGFFEYVLTHAPQHADHIEALRAEHVELLAQAADVRAIIDPPTGPASVTMRERVAALVFSLKQHERLETRLLQDAFEADLEA